MEMRGCGAFAGAQNGAQPGGAPATHGGDRRSHSLAGLLGAPFRLRLSPQVRARRVARRLQGAPRVHRRSCRGTGRRPRCCSSRPSSRGISFSAQGKRLASPRSEALASYLPGSMQRPPRSLWASRLPSRVFKPQHKGHRLRAALLDCPRTQGRGTPAAPGSAGGRPTSHVRLSLRMLCLPPYTRALYHRT